MAERRRGPARAAAGVAAAVLLLAGLRIAAHGDPAGPPAPGTHPWVPAAAGPFGPPPGMDLAPMGAFTDSGADGVRDLAALETWLGGTGVRVGHTYLPGDTWDSVEGGGDLLVPWADWTHAAPGRMFVLNVPMQQDNEAGLSDRRVAALIAAGASGADDVHFARLAERLVSLGVPDTVIVLGWEMNGDTYSHRCGPDPEGWKAYWRRIVGAMRAIPGQRFRFDFAPNRGRDAVPWTACYPGDDAVDVIGMDSYDQPPGESFYDQVTEAYGLQAQVEFAAAHGKPISYPEWGLFRNGDDPDYMSLMLDWITRHHPLYQTLTDYCPHGVWSCAENPRSAEVYRAMLSGYTPAPDPSSEPATPEPATPDPATTTPDPATPTQDSGTPTPTATPPVDPATPATTPEPEPPTSAPQEADPAPDPVPQGAQPG